MTHYVAFLKKELLEYTRTFKLFLMLSIFTIFGITNPLMAKLQPELLKSVMTDVVGFTLPEPTAIDSWTQFFKNTTQMGFIVMIIVFSGILATEISKGTLINMLTKGLSRSAVILSKFTAMVLIWSLSLVICFVLTFGYTVYLFPNDKLVNLAFSVFCLWLFGLFLSALLLLGATLTKNNYGCLLLTGFGIVICFIINIFPKTHKYNPLSLTTDSLGLLTKQIEVTSLYPTLLVTAVLSLLFVAGAVVIFKQKEL